ncbi:DUF4192 domain-containing protein [Amycolatopsis sp. CA-128772]|uniref:DUF4192 domain-containing protein n=1 Tax=Amycolatopsis sp. CA-128772 TaxID=2073159 RepID=UPI000CD1F6A4|nr:DUF4192 domain-containing protein [Amycolatopsis sp. CA-128772]
MTITIDGTSDVLAGLPALFGFVPRRSLVLLSTLHHTDSTCMVGPMIRADLSDVVTNPKRAVDAFARQVGDQPVHGVVAAMIRPLTNPGNDTKLPQRDTADTIAALLTGHGFTDIDVVHVPDIAADARWRSYRTPERTGVLPDPAGTVFAAAAVAEGRIIAADRRDLVARLSPAPEHVRERLREPISTTLADATTDQHRPAAAAARLDRADTAIRAASQGTLPTDDADIIDLAATFAMPAFRDALLALPDNTTRHAAENLILHLWRHSDDPIAGRLATVIGIHAYLRGDGVGAQIALEHADSGQPLAVLLTTMLRHAIAPSKIHGVILNASANARHTLLSEPAAEQA